MSIPLLRCTAVVDEDLLDSSPEPSHALRRTSSRVSSSLPKRRMMRMSRSLFVPLLRSRADSLVVAACREEGCSQGKGQTSSEESQSRRCGFPRWTKRLIPSHVLFIPLYLYLSPRQNLFPFFSFRNCTFLISHFVAVADLSVFNLLVCLISVIVSLSSRVWDRANSE